jgi:hypothetical protein
MRRVATAGPVVMGSGLRSLCEQPRNDDVETFEFRSREPRLQFFEQLLRDDQGRIVEHPAEASERQTERGENRAGHGAAG